MNKLTVLTDIAKSIYGPESNRNIKGIMHLDGEARSKHTQKLVSRIGSENRPVVIEDLRFDPDTLELILPYLDADFVSYSEIEAMTQRLEEDIQRLERHGGGILDF